MAFLISLLFCSLTWAQMGPPLGPPTIISGETLYGTPSDADSGVENQWQLNFGVPLAKTDDVVVISSVAYQNLSLLAPSFVSVPNTRFESVTVGLQGMIHPGNNDGWVLGASFGSASDKIFANSDVFTYNLNVQRRNQQSPETAFLYGFFYSNNAAILPGLPIPTLAYEMQNKETGDFIRIGFPLLVRQQLPRNTQWGLFAVGPIIWDVYLKNTSLTNFHFTAGVQKRPDTFLLSEPAPGSPLNQLMIEQNSLYAQVEFKKWPLLTLGAKFAHHFKNRFRLRETATTRDDFDLKRDFQDYSFIGLNFKIHPPQQTKP